MKERSIRKLLALLLTLCLLLGNVAALAEGDAPTVEATQDEENPADVTVKITGDVEGESWTGFKETIEPIFDENEEPTGERASFIEILPDSVDEVPISEADDEKIAGAEMLTVNAGNVDVTTQGGDWSAGVEAKADWGGAGVTANVEGITVQFTSGAEGEKSAEAEEGAEEEERIDALVRGANAAAYGDEASATINVKGDISATATAGEDSNLGALWVNGAMSESYGNNHASVNVEGSIAVDLTAESSMQEVGAYGAGADGISGGNGYVYVAGDQISVTATSPDGNVDVTGAYANSGGDRDVEAVGTAIGEFDVKQIDVTATGSTGEAKGVDAGAWDGVGGSEITVNNADITATLNGQGEASGVRARAEYEGSSSTVTMNGGSASAAVVYESQKTELSEEDEEEYAGSYGAQVRGYNGGAASAQIEDAELSAYTEVSGIGARGDATGVSVDTETWAEEERVPGSASANIANTDVTATLKGRGNATGVDADVGREENVTELVMNGGSASAMVEYASDRTEPLAEGEDGDWVNATGAHAGAYNGGEVHMQINDAELSAQAEVSGIGASGNASGITVDASRWDEESIADGFASATASNVTASATVKGPGNANGVLVDTSGEGNAAELVMNGGSASAAASSEEPAAEGEEEWSNAAGAQVNASNGGEANAQIDGAKLSAHTDVSGDGVKGNATGVSVWANAWDEESKSNSSAAASVSNTEITAVLQGEGDANGVKAESEGQGNSASLIVSGGSVKATATLKSDAEEPQDDAQDRNINVTGAGAGSWNGSESTLVIDGATVSALTDATGADTWSDATGVDVRAGSEEDSTQTSNSSGILTDVKVDAEAEGRGNAIGIRAEAGYGGNAALAMTDVDVSIVKDNSEGEVSGLNLSASNGGMTTVSGTGVNTDVQGTAQWLRGFWASANDDGELNASFADSSVTATLTGDNGSGEVRGIVLEGNGFTNVDFTGDVTVAAEKGKVKDRVSLVGVEAISNGEKAASSLWVTGEITATNESKLNENEWGGVDAGVTGASVDATGGSSFLGVVGNIVAENTAGFTQGLGVTNGERGQGGVAEAYVDGNVTVDGGEGYTQALSVFTGKDSEATNVSILGDVTAAGLDENGSTKALQLTTEGQATVFVEGTLSAGGLTPIWVDKGSEVRTFNEWIEDENGGHDEVYEREFNYDPTKALLYAWQIETDEDDNIAVVLDLDKMNAGEDAYDEEASRAFEQNIWYIVKIQEAFTSFLKAAGTDTEKPFDYEAAHQDEAVTVTLDIDESEYRFDGIYYNGTTAAEYAANADGSYSVKMLRGGAMELGLNLHKHVRSEIAKENVIAPTCLKDGSHDEVVYCTECNKELSRTAVVDKALGHTPGGAVKENEVSPTCLTEGGYDEVVYCTVCKAELSRTHKVLEKLAHTPGETEKENVKKPTIDSNGGYDEVVYCTVCGTEISRVHEKTDKLPAPMPALKLELVYEPVADDAEINGLKASEKLPMADALKKMGEALDGEGATITIPGIEQVLDEEEMKRFNELSVKERLLVAAGALGFAEGKDEFTNELSEDAAALSDDIASRMSGMSEADKQALQSRIAELFPAKQVTVDGESYEGVSIDVQIDRAGKTTYDRYTFYDKDGEWTLYGIEEGVYREVEA